MSTKPIAKRLLTWYEKKKRSLPWRNDRDPYRIWISEVMLQQTQVDQVIPFYLRFIKSFPSLKTLANAPLEDVYHLWQGLGYYRRARMLHESARIIVKTHKGKLPNDFELLRQLPGFGEYTVGAILSIAYGRPYPAIDGNVNRVISRLFVIHDVVGTSPFKTKVKALVTDILAVNDSASFNQSLMELGSQVCKPKAPHCDLCPISRHCMAYRTKTDPSTLPIRKPSKKKPHYSIAIGIVFKHKRVLIVRRPENGLLGNLWEFPGGKKEGREKLRDTCKRELRNKLNIEIDLIRPLISYPHAYSHLDVNLYFFTASFVKGVTKLKNHTKSKWVNISDLDKFPFPSGHKKAIQEIKRLSP